MNCTTTDRIPADGIDNYDDACEVILTHERAVAEINKHGCMLNEFFDEVGDKPTYTGKEVLDWLGY